MMNVDEILDIMDELLDRSLGVPLSGGKCLVDAEKLRDLINDVRLNMPSEVKQAKIIVADRKIILSEAKREADAIAAKAQEKAVIMVSNEEIVKQAQTKASALIADAQGKSRELRNATNEYCDKTLNVIEEMLCKNLNDVKKTRVVLKQVK